MKKTLFIKNAAYLTASSLILRFAGIIFKIWIAGKIGAEGMGLYQLVFSVLVLGSAFAQSGIPTAVTRLVAENAQKGKKSIGKIMKVTFSINLALSFITAVILFLFSDYIARKIIYDSRTALSIKIIGLAIFFIGVSSIIKAYFIARRKASPTAVSGLIEQSVRIAAVFIFAKRALPFGLSVTCAAVFLGDTIAEIVSSVYLYLRYRFDFSKLPQSGCEAKNPIGEIISISLPLTASRYINQLLRTAENMLVPRALYKYSKKGALSLFGMIKGMALPVLFFPSVILGAVSTLLIPEMSEAKVNKHKGLVRCAVEDVIHSAAITGVICAALFYGAGYNIGFLLYKSADVGFLLTALSPIVPLMYIDSLCDGLLKGLDQQNFCFRVAVGDSALRIVLIFIFVSRFGIAGFIGIMYFSNLLTCLLNVNRLIKISGAELSVQKTVLYPVIFAFTSTLLIKFILGFFALSNLVYIILLCLISTLIYIFLIYRFGCINFASVGPIRRPKKYASKMVKTSFAK